ESDARVALDVDNASEFDLSRGNCIAIATQALLQVGLLRHGEHYDIAFAVQFFGKPLSAIESGFIIVSVDEEQALAFGSIRIYGEHRDTRCDRLVDVVLHQLCIGRRNQNAAGLTALQYLLEGLLLGLGIEAVRTYEFGTHL